MGSNYRFAKYKKYMICIRSKIATRVSKKLDRGDINSPIFKYVDDVIFGLAYTNIKEVATHIMLDSVHFLVRNECKNI